MPVAQTFQNPHDISQTIDLKLGSSGGGTYQFPSDLPKYYTTLNFQQFSPVIGGGTGRSIQQAWSDIAGNLAGDDTQLRDALISWGRNNLTTQAAPVAGFGRGNAQIILPLPVELLDLHQVKWDEKPIMPWSRIGAAALGTAIGGLFGQRIGGLLAGLASGELIRTGVGLIGLAPNEFQTVLFDRPYFKKPKLTFKLSPRTPRESEEIRSIIAIINDAMSPGVSGWWFTFPNIVQVTLRPNENYLYRFKPCVIEDFAIDYVGGGLKAFYHETTAPESVEITLNLLEIEYWLKGDYGV